MADVTIKTYVRDDGDEYTAVEGSWSDKFYASRPNFKLVTKPLGSGPAAPREVLEATPPTPAKAKGRPKK